MRQDIVEAIDELYGYEDLPPWLIDAGKTFVKIRAGADWQGYKTHKITLDDVLHHYAYDARNISSGCRSLGTITGDWRPISNLAAEVLAIFKAVNIKGLRKACKPYAHIMQPRF